MKVEKKRNIGLATLRIYLSFTVVTSHLFLPDAKIRNYNIIKIIKNNNHVPNFYIMSFYLCYNLFKLKNIRKIKIRFQRLLIPYFVWPIIIWLLNNFLSFLSIKLNKISFTDLILQFLTGYIFMKVLWFHYNLIFINLMIIIVHFLFNEKFIFCILLNLKIFGLFFTYSNYNFIFFSQYKVSIKYTFGRFSEIIVYCITGYFLASLKLPHILSKNKIISINCFLSILILIIKYNIFLGIKGFHYQGLKLYTSSISIYFLFYLVPNEIIKNKYIIKFIELISINTAGIYFIHNKIYYYLNKFSLLNHKTLNETIIIYFMAFFISLFGKLISRKTKLINLFQ